MSLKQSKIEVKPIIKLLNHNISGCSLYRHRRAENSPLTTQNSPANVQLPTTIFYLVVEPLSKYSPVTLYLSPATKILKNIPNETLYFRGGSRGRVQGVHTPPPRDNLQFSNTTGILQKKTMWFIGVEVEQETSAPPPEKNPRSAPVFAL